MDRIFFKKYLLKTFDAMKNDFENHSSNLTIPIYQDKNIIGRLRPLHRKYTSEEVDCLMRWRNESRNGFFTWINSTRKSTTKWIDEQILSRPDRILFLAEDQDGRLMGQIGITNCDFDKCACELDNWIKEKKSKISGGMMLAIQSLMDWIFFVLKADMVYARVFIDNEPVISKHKKNGLVVISKVPLKKIIEAEMVRWVELTGSSSEDPDTYYVVLAIKKEGYQRLNHPIA
jgi:RimJ/RimL family protein N-acetyltransferase